MDIQYDNEYLQLDSAITQAFNLYQNASPELFDSATEKYALSIAALGHYFYDRKQFSESLSYYTKATSVIRSWQHTYRTDSRYLELKAAIDRASDDLSMCQNKDYLPKFRRLLFNKLADMGDYFYNKELYSEAMQSYAQARDIDPDDASCLNQIGASLIKFGKFLRATDILELMARRNNNNADKALAWYNISYCLRIEQKWSEAEKAIKKCLKFDPNDVNSLKILEELRSFISKSSFMNFKRGLFHTNLLSNTELSQKRTYTTETESPHM